MAASDEAELAQMVVTAANYNDGPIAFRFPRGNGYGVEIPANPQALEIGKGRVVYSSRHSDRAAGVWRNLSRSLDFAQDDIKGDVAILSYGARLQECIDAAEILKSKNINITIADMRFAKPLNEDLIRELATTHSAIITIEEGSIGGFGSFVLEFMAADGLLDNVLKVRTMHLPDVFQDQDNPDKQYAQAGLDANAIVMKIIQLTDK